MMTLNDLAAELGISVPAARRRLRTLLKLADGHVNGGVTHGTNGRLLVSDTVANILRQAEQRSRQTGVPFAQALAELLDGAKPVHHPGDDAHTDALARAILQSGILVAGATFLGLALVAITLALTR
ncbi:MAG: hypothetical protein H5U03_00810 [Clostridia bacterium]|nr:hypothetical protein [Clostridia bacterium]